MQQSQQQPGAEFFNCRLQRARALPPGQRSPEVAAFVESVDLLREARQLLPLTLPSSGTSGGGDGSSEAGVAHNAVGGSKAAAGCGTAAALGGGSAGSGGDSSQDSRLMFSKVVRQLLVQLLWLVASASIDLGLPKLRLLEDTLRLLSHPGNQAAIGASLRQLAGSAAVQRQYQQYPLLSVRQLQYQCCVMLVQVASRLIIEAEPDQPGMHTPRLPDSPLPASRLPRVAASMVPAADGLLHLEPANPKSYCNAAVAGIALGTKQRAQELNQRAVQLAQQQGSIYPAAGSLHCHGANSG